MKLSPELDTAYAAAWDEWAASTDADLWAAASVHLLAQLDDALRLHLHP